MEIRERLPKTLEEFYSSRGLDENATFEEKQKAFDEIDLNVRSVIPITTTRAQTLLTYERTYLQTYGDPK